jgi:hypothetical protein
MKICYRYVIMGNVFASLHFEYLLGEITVHELSGVVVPVFEIV